MRALLVLVMLASTASPAMAEDNSDQRRALARSYYQRGLSQFNMADYPTAIGFFKRAYALFPQPGFLFNLGQAYRLNRDCSNAASLYRAFLREAPQSPHHRLVSEHLEAMERCVQAQKRQSADIPPPRMPDWANHVPAPRIVDDPRDPPSPRVIMPSPKTKSRTPWLAVSLVGLGAIVSGSGMYFAYDASRTSNEISQLFRDGGAWDSDRAASEDRGRRRARLAWAAGAAGVALVAIGVTLYIKKHRQVRVRPVERGALVTWTSRH